MKSRHTAAPAASPADLSVAPASLIAALTQIADPRRVASTTYAVSSLLALAVTAILANQLSVLAIAEWAARQDATILAPLGLRVGHTPCQSTLQRLFAKLDWRRLSAAMQAAFAPAAAAPPVRGRQGVAVDGKAQRGRLQYQPGSSPVHALTAFCHDSGLVLAQEAIEPATSPADKGEAELTVVPTLIGRLDWAGRVLTGDALFCQRALCRQVLAAGGDYLLIVKANQRTLYADVALLFDPPATTLPALPLTDRREVRTAEQGHGRRAETRQLVASTDLTDYLDWPGLAQVFRLERRWWQKGQPKGQVRYGITSLPPAVADPTALLALKRGHWGVENGLHRTKDVAFAEDASLIHTGQGPMVLAILRDTAVSLLRHAGCRAITARLRQQAQHPEHALSLLLAPLSTHA